MRVVTWNVGNRKNGKAQWEYLSSLKPDIVLLQECRSPLHYIDQIQLHESAPFLAWEAVDGMSRGILVFTNGLPVQQLVLDKFRGRVMATLVTPRPGIQIVVIALHIDTTGKTFRNTIEAARHIFDELSPLLKSNPYIILAGDLNLTVHYRAADGPARDRLVTEFGLVNCTTFLEDKTRFNKNEVSTLRGRLHQDDYIFASPTFEVNHFDILQDTELSDHLPVVVDLKDL